LLETHENLVKHVGLVSLGRWIDPFAFRPSWLVLSEMDARRARRVRALPVRAHLELVNIIIGLLVNIHSLH